MHTIMNCHVLEQSQMTQAFVHTIMNCDALEHKPMTGFCAHDNELPCPRTEPNDTGFCAHDNELPYPGTQTKSNTSFISYSCTLLRKTDVSSETSVQFCRTMLHHIPKACNLHSSRCDRRRKSHMQAVTFTLLLNRCTADHALLCR